ncbi:transcription elongation factor TFIIS [Vermiconidia calcicola]|uniref:Transcription elongation factor TFIIS n=1 Tax=Vermiconidia calcicola TaxID=1690605 RepID=A0ACC3NLI3_9PEZI|nr:transcription elongation factor TFIIS [Vermiconidia calcicola]
MATMDAKQLQENGRQLVKAFESNEPSSTLLTLMQPLEKWTATEDLLRSSKIGVVVAKVRTSKDPKVASLASSLVNKWKAAVKKKHPGAPASPHLAGGANGVANGRSATGSPAPKKEPATSAPKKFTAAPEKRTSKEDGVDTAITGNSIRDGCITLIYNGLCFLSEENPADILNVSQAVEAAAYAEYAPETCATYKQKMRSLHLNLKMKQSGALRRDVFSGAIEPARFVKMTSDELKSEDKRKEDAVLEKENMNKAMTAQEEKAISTTMTCGKCKQSKVAYSQAQTRSADEPMTTFCECTVCGHRWKFS